MMQSGTPRTLQQRCSAQRVLRTGHVPHVQPVLRRRAAASSTCRAAKTFELGTVYSDGKEANWLAPKGGSMAARGVVLFMHGFQQGPNAYYENLRGLADAGLLVVAPVQPLRATLQLAAGLQGSMVEYAAHFHSKLVSNTLPGLPLSSSKVAQNIGLLGHSVGAGLATYVAQQAAAQQQPYKCVMYMAPQTQVVEPYLPETAIGNWPQAAAAATDFALQYGLKDDLAPHELSVALEGQLKKQGLYLKSGNVTVYPDGTHVGFEDQVVALRYEVTSDILPWLNPLLLLIIALSSLGVPFLPWLLGQLKKQQDAAADAASDKELLGAERDEREDGGRLGAVRAFEKLFVNPQDIALLGQVAARKEAEHQVQALAPRPDGIGPPQKVQIASAEASTVQYIGLLAVVAACGVLSASKVFNEGEVHWWPLLCTLVKGYLFYKGVYYLRLQNYVDTVQRPHSRAKAKEFFTRTLL